MEELKALIQASLDTAKKEQENNRSRETAIVITKLQEALLWASYGKEV